MGRECANSSTLFIIKIRAEVVSCCRTCAMSRLAKTHFRFSRSLMRSNLPLLWVLNYTAISSTIPKWVGTYE